MLGKQETVGVDGTVREDAQFAHAMPPKFTVADRGLVEVPLLAPHLRFDIVDGGTVLLHSENFETAIHGDCLAGLLPLLDGSRTRGEIAARLAPRHAAVEVQTALVSLASSGYVVSAEFDMSREMAAFWSALGASPRWAQERLAARAVSVSGDNGQLAARCDGMGLRVSPTPPADETGLSVYVCSDYLDADHARINASHIASGAPWVLVRPRGVEPLFGPVFQPGGGGPCWECLAFRLRANRQVDSFLRAAGAVAGDLARPPVEAPALTHAAHGLAAVEIAKWVVFETSATLGERAVSLSPSTLETTRHWVGRRPQCRACGDRGLSRPDRAPLPVRLRPSPGAVRNSGGLRAVTPEQTLAKFGHLVSPFSGVVTRIDRTTDFASSWFHVYVSRSDIGHNVDNFHELSGNLRSRSAGKGSTAPQSRASALCEAVERTSSTFQGDEIIRRRRFVEFPDAGGDTAIHPNEVELFSETQFDQAERSGHSRLDSVAVRVPPRFNPEAEISWSPVWSLTRDCVRLLPTSLLYRNIPLGNDEELDWKAHTNGCSAGNTLEEAVLQGFLELVERDSVAVWWFNRLRRPAVDLDCFGDEYLSLARGRYAAFNRELWLLDLTADLGIPVFAAISRRTDGPQERIIFGFGAHLDPRIAALRAVCETNQFLSQFHEQDAMDPDAAKSWLGQWLREAVIDDHAYLVPKADCGPSKFKDHVAEVDGGDVRDDIEHCRRLVEAKGLEFLVLDLTRPDIGMPAARVIVPGLRHFWRRLAPGRLYQVPVDMGWRKSPLAEKELNPLLVAG